MNFFLIFITGLTTGGLSCLAMQGGLLASVIANQKDQERDEIIAKTKPSKKKKGYIQTLESTATEKTNFTLKSFDTLDWLPVAMFLGAKLIAHVALGFLLGLLGSAISLSLGVRLAFQTFTALFMLATAMNLLDVHPIFRYVVFQPPKFIQRMVRNSGRSKALFAPAILGFLTIFIPCGVTQAMEVLAINSGNPIYGALIMFFFVLGTTPLFAVLGVATAKLAEGWYKNFTRLAAISLVGMALYSLNGVMIVLDSPITAQKVLAPIQTAFSGPPEWYGDASGQVTNNNPVIQVLNNGYSPKVVRVQKNMPVTLTLQSKDTYSCALSFVLKEFGISAFLKATDTQSFTFTPTKAGKYTFTCSMGMYTGTLEVI